MGTNAFAEFVASQQPAAENAEIDWATERAQYLRDVDRLYGQVTEFLKEFVDKGTISYSFTDVSLTEENLGTYSARRMDIQIGRRAIYLEPVGTLLIGNWGRVDVVGPTGRAQIILVDQKAKSPGDLIKVRVSIGGNPPPAPASSPSKPVVEWKIVARRPQWTFISLDKESFFDLVMEIANA
jgi:hypothetical protein